IARRSPISLLRLAGMAAAGAAALGVIFGALDAVTLLLIAASGGAGACLRRWLSHLTRNAFVQPFCAALLAGVVGAIATRLHLSPLPYLVAECPCMILVPGAHLLNGALDLARARVTLGIARVAFAGLVVLAISAGLLLGLALGGTSLPVAGSPPPAPLLYDAVAAGVAVAAYGTFFSMSWRMLYVPVVIGMVAHAARWAVVVLLGADIAVGALVACLMVGIVVAMISDSMRLPFAGLAFASVVSLIPGVFLFRMAGGLVQLVGLGEHTPLALLTATIADGGTAFVTLMAMAFGLLVPRMIVERLR
ncbi:MAG TPA: threonine/serine exporter family protein, partial [Rhizomicrobium sp.]